MSHSELGASRAWLKPPLRDLLAQKDHFVVASELVTSRGLVNESHASAWANTVLGRDHQTTGEHA